MRRNAASVAASASCHWDDYDWGLVLSLGLEFGSPFQTAEPTSIQV